MMMKRVLGLAAVAGLLMIAAPAERAEALSLGTPGVAAAIQDGAVTNVAEEVRWHRGWRRHHGWHRHHGWRRHHWHRRHWRRW